MAAAPTMSWGGGGGATRARAWKRDPPAPERLLAEVGRLAPSPYSLATADADDLAVGADGTGATGGEVYMTVDISHYDTELEVDGEYLCDFLKQSGPVRPGSPLPHGRVPNVKALQAEAKRLEAEEKRLMNKWWKQEKAAEREMAAASDPTIETATPSEQRPRSPDRPEGDGIGEMVVNDDIRALVAQFHTDFVYQPQLPDLRKTARKENRAAGPGNFLGIEVGQRFKLRSGPKIKDACAPCGFGSSKNTGRKVMPKTPGPGPGGWGVKPSVFNKFAQIEDKWRYEPLEPIPGTPRDGNVAAVAAAQKLMPSDGAGRPRSAGSRPSSAAAVRAAARDEAAAAAGGDAANSGAIVVFGGDGGGGGGAVVSCSSTRFVHPRALAEAQEAARLAALPDGHRELLQALPEKRSAKATGAGAGSPRTPAVRRSLPPGFGGGASTGAESDAATDDRLFAAAMAGKAEECLWLLGSYADDRPVRERLVNFVHPLTGMSPFLYAAYHGLADVAAALLRPGCGFEGVNDLDGNHRSALHLAARRGHAHLCRLLLDCGEFSRVNNADGDSYHKTALHHAAEKGLADVCLLLIDHPAFNNVAARDVSGRTALHWAAVAGLADVCTRLLAHEVFRKSKQANHQDKRFKTAMHYCLDNLKDCASGGNARPHRRVRAALLAFSDSPKFWCCEDGSLPPPAETQRVREVSKENAERARKAKERIAAREQAQSLLFGPCKKNKKKKKRKGGRF